MGAKTQSMRQELVVGRGNSERGGLEMPARWSVKKDKGRVCGAERARGRRCTMWRGWRARGGQGGLHGMCHGHRRAESCGEGLSAAGTAAGDPAHPRERREADAEAEGRQSLREPVDLNSDMTRTEPSGNLSLPVPSSDLQLHGGVGAVTVRVS